MNEVDRVYYEDLVERLNFTPCYNDDGTPRWSVYELLGLLFNMVEDLTNE